MVTKPCWATRTSSAVTSIRTSLRSDMASRSVLTTCCESAPGSIPARMRSITGASRSAGLHVPSMQIVSWFGSLVRRRNVSIETNAGLPPQRVNCWLRPMPENPAIFSTSPTMRMDTL